MTSTKGTIKRLVVDNGFGFVVAAAHRTERLPWTTC
jgi:hypothetical protein